MSYVFSYFNIAVIEGDQQTSNDAERICATGALAVQINTGKGCHLDAHMVAHALDRLPLQAGDLLFIENVGNLVCPAAFDLGKAHKVVVLSVTEGEDKPLKYPDMFAAADLMLLNKADLLPHLDFDLQSCIDYARQVNHKIEIHRLGSHGRRPARVPRLDQEAGLDSARPDSGPCDWLRRFRRRGGSSRRKGSRSVSRTPCRVSASARSSIDSPRATLWLVSC